jgi:hypothetical protein
VHIGDSALRRVVATKLHGKVHVLNGDDVWATAVLLGECDDQQGLPGGYGWMKVTDIRPSRKPSKGKKKTNAKQVLALTVCPTQTLSSLWCHHPEMLQATFDLKKFGLKSGGLASGKRKWVVSNLTGTQTYANMAVSTLTH